MLELSVCKKLNSSYGENTTLYIHRLMIKQMTCQVTVLYKAFSHVNEEKIQLSY